MIWPARLLLLTLACLIGSPATAQRRVPQRLPVAVLTLDEAEPATADGLTRFIDAEAKGRQDSVKDLRARLALNSIVHVRPARDGETPLVTVVVLKREYIDAQDEAHIITARVEAAGATREVTSSSDSWRESALMFARQLDAWVGANYDVVKAGRPAAK